MAPSTFRGTFHSFGPFRPPADLPERRVHVYVPRGASSAHPRPALYMFDGQNIFGDEGAFAGGWHLHEAVDRMSPRTNHVPIVIGIEHGGQRRIEELSPWAVQGRKALADPFLDWLVESLIPELQRELPLLRGPVGAVVGGSSMGGLGALYAHYRHPQTFGGAISMSPAYWVGGKRFFDFLARTERPPISRVYIDCGLKEGYGRMAALAERAASALESKGYDDQQLRLRLDPRGTHSERHWKRRARTALRFMFRR